MIKTIILLVAVLFGSLRTTSMAQSLETENNAITPDELSMGIDEDSRYGASTQAFGASLPTDTRLMPGPGVSRLHQCYVCTNCPTVLPNTTYKACPYSADDSKNNRCVVYSEKYRHMEKPWNIRGCASERGNCAEITKAHSTYGDIVKLDSCYECEGDKCNVNGGTRPISGLVAFLVLVVAPVLAIHTLS